MGQYKEKKDPDLSLRRHWPRGKKHKRDVGWNLLCIKATGDNYKNKGSWLKPSETLVQGGQTKKGSCLTPSETLAQADQPIKKISWPKQPHNIGQGGANEKKYTGRNLLKP